MGELSFEVFVFPSTSLCSIMYSSCWHYNKLCYTAYFIPSVATGSGKVCVFSLASGSLREPGINNHNITLFLLVSTKCGLVQPEPKVMTDNHQDPHNPQQQLPRWPATILYSNMQTCWQPIKSQLSAHIPRHIPSGSIFSSLLPQYGCHERETHAKHNLSLGRNWQYPLLGFGRMGTAWLLRHSALLPERCVASSSWMPGALVCRWARI